MTTFFQKLFLSKDKRAILNAIEQNADKIVSTYSDNMAGAARHTFTISTPTIELLSVFEIPSRKITYQFDQYKPDGQILRSQKSGPSTFATNVRANMFCKFVEKRGIKNLCIKYFPRTKQQ